MPRTGAAGEAFKKLTAMTLYRIKSGGGDTLTTADVTGAGTETTVAVTSATGFTAADTAFIIGENGMEQVIVGTPATTMPVTPPPKIAAATGARFVESDGVSLGKMPLGSVSWTANRPLNTIYEEIGDAPLFYLPGNVDFELAFALFGYNGPNIQVLLGYAESETGDGAAYATAHQAAAGLPDQALHGPQIMRVRGIRHDGKKVEIDFLNAYFQAAINSALSRENPAQLQGSVKASALIVRTWT